MVSLTGNVESRVYLGVSTQITVSLGDGARIVALEQATYRASADDRWEDGHGDQARMAPRELPGPAVTDLVTRSCA